MKAVKEMNLQILTDEMFAALCHMVLLEVHGICYKPVAGEGGDSGIDGFVNDCEVVYQFKFFKTRPRPASFLSDIDKVAHLPNLKQWFLLIPEDPTERLYQLIAEEKASRSFNVDVFGKTWLLLMLEKYKHIKDRFFAEVAKEASVQKVIHLSEIEKVVKGSSGSQSFGKICSNLKNKYRVGNWQLIRDDHFSDIMDWLRKYYYATRVEHRAPGKIRNELIGVIKSQQRTLTLNDKAYRGLLVKLTGKNSSTLMEIYELKIVRDHLNILLGLKR